MADGSSPPKLVFTLAGALGIALLAIAFLAGRESARSTTATPSPLPPTPAMETETGSDATPARDPWRIRDEEYASIDAHRAGSVELEVRPDGRVVLSNVGHDERPPTGSKEPTVEAAPAAEPSTGDAVDHYFLQMDAIQSHAGAGDPNTFAMDVIKAGLGGATSGFDQLIADSKRMTKEIEAVTPPPSCAGYHEATLASLAEARDMLKDMRGAVTTADVQALNAIALEASELRARAEALAELQQQIRSSTR